MAFRSPTRLISNAHLPLVGLDGNEAVTGQNVVVENLVSVTKTCNGVSPQTGCRDEATEDPDEPGNKLERFEVLQK